MRTTIAALSLLLAVPPAAAQTDARPSDWLLGLGVANYALAEEHGTGWGPEAVARRRLGTAIVIQARVIVIPSSSGFYDFGGAAADLGVGVLTGSARLDAALVAGLSGLAGGDSDGSFYTGWTTDPPRRERQHNLGRGARYTRARRPVMLVYLEEQADRAAAMRRERAIKKLPRQQKSRLIVSGGRQQAAAPRPHKQRSKHHD